MNNNRNYIDAILVIALIALGVFLFNRVQNLNTTQTELADAQAEITQAADLAATYAEEGTAVAESAAAAARLATDELGYANSTATQAAVDSASALNNANATASQAAADSASALDNANAAGTQAAADSADALDSANMTATQAAIDSADALTSANSTATRAANVARTQTANSASTQAAAQAENETLSTNLSNAEATNSAALELQATGQAERESLEDEVAALSTAQASLETLTNAQMTAIANLNTQLNTAYVQRETQEAALTSAEATIAAQADIIASAPTGTSNNTVAEDTPAPQTNEKGLVLFETDTIQIYLPPDYIAVNPDDGLDAALELIGGMGPEYQQSLEFLRQNADSIQVWAARTELTSDGLLENIIVFHQQTLIPISLETFMTIGYQGMPADADITVQEIIELNGQEVLRTIINFDFGFGSGTQVQYVYVRGANIYLVVISSSSADFSDREDLFEAIAATLVIRE